MMEPIVLPLINMRAVLPELMVLVTALLIAAPGLSLVFR